MSNRYVIQVFVTAVTLGSALLIATPQARAQVTIGSTTLDVGVQADGFASGGSAGNTVRVVSPATFWSNGSTANNDGLWYDRALTGFIVSPPAGLTRTFELTGGDRTAAPDLRTTVTGPAGTYYVYVIYISRSDLAAQAALEARLGTSGAFTAFDETNAADTTEDGTWDLSIGSLGSTNGTGFTVDVSGTASDGRNDYIGVGYNYSAGGGGGANESTGPGAWDTDGTWTDGVPTSDDDVVIKAGHLVTISGLATQQVNSLSISGTLTHAANSTVPATHKINLEIAGDLTIPAGGAIDVQGKGYTGGNGPGFHTGYAAMKGGAHGGQGRGYDDNDWHDAVQLATGNTYGSAKTPTDPGSGGSVGAGGGVVILNVGGQTSLDGVIIADGLAGNRPGAGGSIWLTTGTLVGSGTNSVKGYCTGYTAGGGGGRLAVVVTNGTDTGSVAMHAWGGYNPATGIAGPYPAAAGTIFVKTAGETHGRLIVDNNGTDTAAPNDSRVRCFTGLDDDDPSDGIVTTNMFDAIIVTNYGLLFVDTNCVLDLSNNPQIVCDGSTNAPTSRLYFGGQGEGGEWRFPATFTFTDVRLAQLGTNQAVWETDLTLGSDAVLSHEFHPAGAAPATASTFASMRHRLNLRIVGDLTVSAGGAVDVEAKGFGALRGPGFEDAPSSIDAAGHGGEGRGYNGSAVVPLGFTYGSIREPMTLGSGSNNKAGGGAARLDVSGTCTINGTIDADGDSTLSQRTGSGGSVYITADSLAGSGEITASSFGYGGRGAGGGGRIAVVLTNSTGFGSVTLNADGGAGGGYNAGGGTIYLQHGGQSHGTLIVDNHALATTSKTRISSDVTDTVVGTVDIRADGQLALSVNQGLTVHGSWTNAGDFAVGDNSTVTFAGTDTATVVGSSTFGTLVCTTATKRIDFDAGSTFTASNGLTLAGSAGNLIDLNSTAPGTQWALTLNAGGAQSVSYVDVQDSDASGGDQINASDSTDSGNNDNWNFGGAATITWDGSSNTAWNVGENWDSGTVPTAIDNVVIPDVANDPVLDADRAVADLTLQSGAILSLAGNNFTVSGAADVDGTITASGSEVVTFSGNADFTGGTFNPASSTVILNGAAAQVLTGDGNTFHLLDVASANGVTLADAFTADRVLITNTSSTVTFSGSFTTRELDCRAPSSTLTFGSGTTGTVTELGIQGSSGNNVSLGSSSPGSAWSLVADGWHSVRYVTVQDSDASGGETIYAVNSTDSGNNVNWDFEAWHIWDGSDSSDWGTPANWVNGTVPGPTNRVLIDGNGPNAPAVASDITVERLRIGPTADSVLTSDSNLTVTVDVLIGKHGTLTHTANPVGNDDPYKLRVTVGGDLSVASGGSISAQGKGYAGTYGPGFQSGQIGSAAYGGQGHGYDQPDYSGKGTCYGSITAPTDLGSGGHANRGGGAVILNVSGACTVNGTIDANAEDVSLTGSGGSVYVTAGTFGGNGALEVISYGYIGAGAGGGGRIAVILSNSTSFGNVTFNAEGGNDHYEAAAGTVYLKRADQAYGTLRVNNHATPTPAHTVITSNVTDTTVGTVVLGANAQVRIDPGETLTVRGSWTNNGTFVAGAASTVDFAGPDAAVLAGSTDFGLLVCTTAAKRIDFTAGDTFSVSNGLTLTGSAGNLLDLNSTSPGSQWQLDLRAGAAQSVSYVDVQDSDASGGDQINAADSTDSGNNDNWNFAGAATITWDGSTDTDWGTGDNWDSGTVPTAIDSVIIPDVANDPVLDANRAIVGLTIESGATLSCGGFDLTVDGGVDIDGTLIATGSETVRLNGQVDFTGGGMTPADSTVVIGGTITQTVITAGATFNTLRLANSNEAVVIEDGFDAVFLFGEVPGGVYYFGAGDTLNVTNLRLKGASGNELTVHSASPGSQWNLNVGGWESVRYVNAKDSNAGGGNTVHAIGSTDAGNNVNWDFTGWELWTGAASSDFAANGNWSDGTAPTSGSYVLIDGDGANAPVISAATTIARLTVGESQSSTLTVNTNLTVTEDVLIMGNGTITHSANPAGTAEPHKLNMTVGGRLTILTGGSVDATAKGFPAQNGPGTTTNPYGGAAYGGQGEGYVNPNQVAVGTCYGSFLQPSNLGSGGIQRGGGGAVRLQVSGTLELSGSILAEGDPGNSGFRTGSGGSVWIAAGSMVGTGLVSVSSYGNGGGGGAGGGGRMAVELTSGTDFGDVTFKAEGGNNGYFAAAGSIYRKHTGQAYGQVIVDNGSVPRRVAVTQLPSPLDAVTKELKNVSLVLTNTTWMALTTNAYVGDIVIHAGVDMDLGGHKLYVGAYEHDLGDPTVSGPGNTNRVDVYENIIWGQRPTGTVMVIR